MSFSAGADSSGVDADPDAASDAVSDATAATWALRRKNDFENAKAQCLGKRDKSFAGRIDPHAVEICGILNEREDCYTTSSCSGRCFMYRGSGIKSTQTFTRFRISHEKIKDPIRFFNLSTIEEDPSGGGDPIRTIGQYDYTNNNNNNNNNNSTNDEKDGNNDDDDHDNDDDDKKEKFIPKEGSEPPPDKAIWLRFEPFILHVACRSLSAASALMAAARPAFKNVGLTTWKENRYLVAIWGDEGLDMPLTLPCGTPLFGENNNSQSTWLAELINERHERNWNKIARFCTSAREMAEAAPFSSLLENPILVHELLNEEQQQYDNNNLDDSNSNQQQQQQQQQQIVPRSYDVIGDIAYLHSMPERKDVAEEIGDAIMKKNKSIKLVVARTLTLNGTERAPGEDGLTIIAGAGPAHINRSPLITTHTEYGIKCVVDLNHTFFSPRMGQERLRICQNVARGEYVLVLFAGVGMEALQIAGRTEASSIVAVELNDIAVQCFRRAHRMLERNKAVKCPGAAERLRIIHGDVLEILPRELSLNSFDRILAPRPKEGALDGDLGSGDGGEIFLDALLPFLKEDGGECHWYDFAADHEYPECKRTKTLIEKVCEKHGLSMEVLHVARVGSIAKRQLRVCMDFKVFRR